MTAVDMTASIVPRSDQLNAEDLLAGPRTVTITGVKRGSAEQPVDVYLAEFDRPYKPSKTCRRILVAAWGADAAKYVGRQMTIYRDPSVKFGGLDVGGIRISHMSHIDKRLTVALMVTRGKRAPYVVEPLVLTGKKDEQPVPQAVDFVEEICSPATSLSRLRQISAELSRHQLTGVIVTNETGDDEQIGDMCTRIGKARKASGGEIDVQRSQS